MSRWRKALGFVSRFFEAIGRAEAQKSGAVFPDQQKADVKRYIP